MNDKWRIVIVNEKATSQIRRVLSKLQNLGYNALFSQSPICKDGYLNIIRPGSREKYRVEECVLVDWIPHIQLVPDLVASGVVFSDDGPRAMALYLLEKLDTIRRMKKPYGGLPLSLRPPPFTIVAEVYYRGYEWTLEKAYTFLAAEADAVSIGIIPGLEPSQNILLRLVEELSKDTSVCIDTVNYQIMASAIERGAVCGLSLTHTTMHNLPVRLRDKAAYVFIPETRNVVGELVHVYEEALRAGYSYPIIDPVLYPPIRPGVLERFLYARELASSISAPLMLGINNVYELVDADTPGLIALLLSLAGEAGVSVILVSEESPKARGAVLETRLAASLVELSLFYGTPPKDYPVRLLFLKSKR
ncbi:MAG: hypothetical protein GSR77_07685 [Desulfurococcales archaeon]|nr:hypothetical protein [Desulfurococcales archaeon]